MLTLCTLQCVPFSFDDPNKLAEIRYYAFMQTSGCLGLVLFLFSVLFSVLRSSILHICVLSSLPYHSLISSSPRLFLWV